MIVSRVGIAGLSLADSLMVARYSPSEMAVLGLAEGTLGRVLDVTMAFLLAGMPLATRALGAGMLARAGAVWRRGAVLAIAAGGVGAAIGCAAPVWLGWLHQPDTLADGAGPVLAALGLSMPFALFAVVSAVFLESIGHPVVTAVAVVGANLLNLLCNWLLIGGHAGLPALGALGSVIGTGIVRLAIAGVFAAAISTLPERRRLGIGWRRTSAGGDGGAQLGLGAGAAATAGVLHALMLVLTVMAGWFGTLSLAAFASLWSALSIGGLVAFGLGDATAIRVASSKNSRQAARATLAGLAVTALALLICAAPAALWPDRVAGLYAREAPFLELLAALLPAGALVLLLDGLSFVLEGSLRGQRQALRPAIAQIVSVAALLPLAYWLAIERSGGVLGLVVAIAAADALRGVLMVALLLRLRIDAAPAVKPV